MLKKLLTLFFACIVVVAGFGCGGGGGDEAVGPPPDPASDPAVQEAQEAQASGQPLTGKQKRLLENVEERQAEESK